MKTIKLTENKLNQIISESVTEILKEMKENKQLKESKQENKQVRLTEAELTRLGEFAIEYKKMTPEEVTDMD